MKVAVACDHAGFPLKDVVIAEVARGGHEPLDLGTFSQESVDYPDFAEKVGRAIQQGEADRGIILCGSGVGAAIAANKMRGVRAGLCHDTYTAHQSVEHDDVNVLSLGARVIGSELMLEIVRTFLGAHFSGEERHIRRVAKVNALEQIG
jgi:RpiB/LacA/LacB family sugar-phosphate isomerase